MSRASFLKTRLLTLTPNEITPANLRVSVVSSKDCGRECPAATPASGHRTGAGTGRQKEMVIDDADVTFRARRCISCDGSSGHTAGI